MQERVWMRPPDGGPPQKFEATQEVLVPLMVAGWNQCQPPEQPDGQEES